MKQKSYSIATPSFVSSTKSYSLEAPLRTSKAKVYGLSLSVIAPFIDNKKDYPIRMPASSRLSAYVDEDVPEFGFLNAKVRTTALSEFVLGGVDIRERGAMLHANSLLEGRLTSHVFSTDIIQAVMSNRQTVHDMLIHEGQVSSRDMVYLIQTALADNALLVNTLDAKLLETIEFTLLQLNKVSLTESYDSFERLPEYDTAIATNDEALRLVEILNGRMFVDAIKAQRKVEENLVSLLSYDLADYLFKLYDATIEEMIEFSGNAFETYMPKLILATAPREVLDAQLDTIEQSDRSVITHSAGAEKISSSERLIETLLSSIHTLNQVDRSLMNDANFRQVFFDLADIERKVHEVVSHSLHEGVRSESLAGAWVSTYDIEESYRIIETSSAYIDEHIDGERVSLTDVSLHEPGAFDTSDSSYITTIADIEMSDSGQDYSAEINELVEGLFGTDGRHIEVVDSVESVYGETNSHTAVFYEPHKAEVVKKEFYASVEEFIGFNGSAFLVYLAQLTSGDKKEVVPTFDIISAQSSNRKKASTNANIISIIKSAIHQTSHIAEIAKLFSSSKTDLYDSIIELSTQGSKGSKTFDGDLIEFDGETGRLPYHAIADVLIASELAAPILSAVITSGQMFGRDIVNDAFISYYDDATREMTRQLELAELATFGRTVSEATIHETSVAVRVMTYLTSLDEYEPVNGPDNPEYTWLWHSRPSWWSGWNWHKTK